MIDLTQFDILQPGVFKKLRDPEWFRASIALEYRNTAAAFDCVAVMSGERLTQTFDIFWHDADGGMAKNMPEDTKSLDQFKLSSYLCFWLRRINPVREIRPAMTLGRREEWVAGQERLGPAAENFMLYGNEIAALVLAVKLAQYLALVASQAHEGVAPLRTAEGLPIRTFDQDTIVEFGKILKHKNISAHGLNMALQMLCGVGQKISFF